VLAGSSGAVDSARAAWLAERGATAASIRWFGGPGQPPGICEVPLETFDSTLEDLRARCERLVVLGVSKGAEAALLLATHHSAIDVVVAFAPTHVVWANIGAGRDGRTRPCRSSWTWQGNPVAFVPYDDDWEPRETPPSYRGMYEQSLRTHPAEAATATIRVEHIQSEVILVAGGDDRVWPSLPAARAIESRRAEHGLDTTLVSHDHAGHRTLLPGEPRVSRGADMARGGTLDADAELGLRAWQRLKAVLGLDDSEVVR
jgi:dienelactone hydrolase